MLGENGRFRSSAHLLRDKYHEIGYLAGDFVLLLARILNSQLVCFFSDEGNMGKKKNATVLHRWGAFFFKNQKRFVLKQLMLKLLALEGIYVFFFCLGK